jgi:hypothetical protein
MKPSNKFNHRPNHERLGFVPNRRSVQYDPHHVEHPVFATTGSVDEDFEDFGERVDYVVAPGLTVHSLGVDIEGHPLQTIERVRHAD